MRTDPSGSDPTSEPTDRLPPAPPPPPFEPQRLHREAVLVVQDRGRTALLVGLCTLAGVAAGFAMATLAGARAVTAQPCEVQPLPPPAPSPPIQAQPAPYGHGGGGGHGNGHGHWHGPWGQYWRGPSIDIDINPSARAWLGVTTETVQGGARITTVAPGSPAASAGLVVGDVITEVDGEQVATPTQLAKVIGDLEPGKQVEVKVVRAGKAMTLRATVVERP